MNEDRVATVVPDTNKSQGVEGTRAPRGSLCLSPCFSATKYIGHITQTLHGLTDIRGLNKETKAMMEAAGQGPGGRVKRPEGLRRTDGRYGILWGCQLQHRGRSRECGDNCAAYQAGTGISGGSLCTLYKCVRTLCCVSAAMVMFCVHTATGKQMNEKQLPTPVC